MKPNTLHLTLLLLGFLTTLAPAADFASKDGKLTVEKLGEWTVKSDEVLDGDTHNIKLTVQEANMHADFRVMPLSGFDVDLAAFQESLISGLKAGNMEITTSYLGTWEGNKCFKVFATKKTEDVLVHVVSMNAFFGGNFVSLSIADDDPGIESSDYVKHLLSNITVAKD